MVEGIVLKEQYNVLKEIGSGSFGKVYKVEDSKSKQHLAIKRINKKDLEENEYLHQAFWKELEVMKKCECDNSVRLVEHFLSSNFYNIVMELCDTDLEIVLSKRSKGFSEEEVRILLKQLNNVFKIMDKENIIHRDLKLRNIMIVFNKPDQINISPNYPLNLIAKLSDFGFSKVMDDDITRTKLGTPATMAPEILMNKNYTKKADMWSIGIITYQLLFKMLPFKARNEKELLNNILNHKGIRIPEGYKISDSLFDLLKNLLQIDPNNRLSWKEYFEHPFFSEKSKPLICPSDFEKFEKKYVNMRKLSEDFSEYKISKAKNKDTGEFVLIKEIARSAIDYNPVNKAIFQREMELMHKFKSDHFIKLIDFFQTNTHYFIITEYFEGKILENFLSSRKSLSESLVQQIIRGLAPAFKELHEANVVLDFISTKSFCFKFYKSEENFKIKFFDYGLSIIFTDVPGQRGYLLNEGKYGNVTSEKTNVLSMGMVVYKLLFGETIYNFSLEEDPEITISKKKQIKLPKNISKACKHLIEKTCHQNKDKRYDWKNFLEDSFVKIRYCEDIRVKPNSLSFDSQKMISDYKVENLAENLKYKTEVIINYYNKLLNDNEVELSNYQQFFKEMSIFTMLAVLEIKLFQEFLKPKEKFYEDEELHLLKITTNKEYEYCYCNFLKHNITINKENPMIDSYMKIFSNIEIQLLDIIKQILKRIDINVDEVQSYDYLATSIKNYYFAHIEKYFFKLFENGLLYYSKSELKEALNEFLISKYFYESIIFIRLISSNKPETTNFFKLFECIENDDEINLFSNENKTKKQVVINPGNLIVFTFLGGIIKTFKAQKILEEELASESLIFQSNESIESLIKFYPEIVKMILECSKSD